MHCSGSSGRVGAEGALKFRRVGLPEGEDFDCVLEVAAEGAGAHVGSEDLAGVNTSHKEFEVVAIFGDSEATLHDGSDLEGLVAFGDRKKGLFPLLTGGLSGRGPGNDEQEEDCPEGGCSKAYELLDHLDLRCCGQQKKGRR